MIGIMYTFENVIANVIGLNPILTNC